ncbi:MAG: hypothetical protein RLZZ535_2988 [Cyanobacteriota bacterium]|jgi:hypothetical protein
MKILQLLLMSLIVGFNCEIAIFIVNNYRLENCINAELLCVAKISFNINLLVFLANEYNFYG